MFESVCVYIHVYSRMCVWLFGKGCCGAALNYRIVVADLLTIFTWHFVKVSIFILCSTAMKHIPHTNTLSNKEANYIHPRILACNNKYELHSEENWDVCIAPYVVVFWIWSEQVGQPIWLNRLVCQSVGESGQENCNLICMGVRAWAVAIIYYKGYTGKNRNLWNLKRTGGVKYWWHISDIF